jgi:ArsR family transcriptional regulator, arsenate/arsenite/antimonite-responsive transcriptional repressor
MYLCFNSYSLVAIWRHGLTVISPEDVLKVLSDKTRLRIFKMLEIKECCVCELAYVLKIKQPSVSGHLKKIRDVGLVESRQDGVWTSYSLAKISTPYLKPLLAIVLDWLDQDEHVVSDRSKIRGLDKTKFC